LSDAAQVKGVIDAANNSFETPGSDKVVEAFVGLIETAAGERDHSVPYQLMP
jgi:hypothetical protein